jgi:hypothetical protein
MGKASGFSQKERLKVFFRMEVLLMEKFIIRMEAITEAKC